MISVRLAGWPASKAKTLMLQFFQTVNAMNVKLCMMMQLSELYPLVPLSVTVYFKLTAVSVNNFN